jgi:TPR repeat protein
VVPQGGTGRKPLGPFNLNLCYLLGIGTRQDYKKAFRCVHQSAYAGYPDAILALGWHYHNGRGVKLRLAELWYRKSSRIGDPSAQFSLGQLYFDQGRYEIALKWFRKGVAQDHARSRYCLGRMYLEGRGVCPDVTRASVLLRRAVQLRVSPAKKLLRSKWFKRLLAEESHQTI